MRLRLPTRHRRTPPILLLVSLAACTVTGTALVTSPKPPLYGATPFSTAFHDREGNLLRLSLAHDDKYRLFTPLEDMSADLITATLAQEDRHFYAHPGVNPFSLVRAAFETYAARSRPMGGSTVTMQLVRMRDALDTRGIAGKIVQIWRALVLERHYGKDEILEAYLNLAPYGGNIHGAGTASLIYFHREAADLAMPQSLALAVIPQNPVRRNPHGDDKSAWNDARARLFARLPERYRQFADLSTLPLPVYGREDLPFLAPHFVDGLKEPSPGRIRTTLDGDLQSLLEERVSAWLARERSLGLTNAAAMLVHFPSMEVRALLGSGDFFDPSINGQVDGTLARRSPGSTLKPFIYALALEQGLIHPQTLLSDDPAAFAEYKPGNFDRRFIGQIPATEALRLSRNIPAIALAAEIDEPDLYAFLQQAGADLPKNASHYGLSIAVGGAEVDMRTIVKLYALLANGGVLRELRTATDRKADTLRPMLSPEAAILTLLMLEQERPDTLPFTNRPSLPVYWKTGTSSGFRDAWTVGVIGPYVLAVWTGHFDGRPSPALVGSEAAMPLFLEIADALARRERLEDAIHPAADKLNIARVALGHREGWFIPGKSPISGPRSGSETPEILSPRAGIAYVASEKSGEPSRIPLEAKTASGSDIVYWFADNRLIGTSAPDRPLFWAPSPGRHTVRAVETTGRSAAQEIKVVSD